MSNRQFSNILNNKQREVFSNLVARDPVSSRCFECGATNPAWVSTQQAILLCLDCCSRFYHLGVHISFLRSICLDPWEGNDRFSKFLDLISIGGNGRCRDYFERHGVPTAVSTTSSSSSSSSSTSGGRAALEARYTHPAAVAYVKMLAAEVAQLRDSSSPPNITVVVEIPHNVPSRTQQSSNDNTFFTGTGVDSGVGVVSPTVPHSRMTNRRNLIVVEDNRTRNAPTNDDDEQDGDDGSCTHNNSISTAVRSIPNEWAWDEELP